jgi:hypothetical protein
LIGLAVWFSPVDLITDFYKIAIGLCLGLVAADYFDDFCASSFIFAALVT